MRFRYSLVVLAALLALPAAAQDYGVISQADLDANTGTTDVEPRCLIAFEGSLLFYDSAGGDVLLYDPAGGSDTGTLLSKDDIDAAAGFEVDRCLAIFFQDEGGVARTFFAFGSGEGADEAERPEVVLLFDGDGDTLTRVVAPEQAAGTYALAASGSTLYLGRVQFRGAPEDGVYSVATTGADQAPAVVVQDADLDLLDIDVASDGSLYAVSSEFGDGDYENAVVRITDPAGTPALSVAFDPCDGAGAVFSGCDDGGIEEIEIVEAPDGTETILLSNNQFSDDVVVVAFGLDGTPGRTVFSGNALVADPDVSETTFTVAFDNYLAYDPANDVVYVAARARADTDAEAIYFAEGAFDTATSRLSLVSDALEATNPVRGRGLVRVRLQTPVTGRLVAYDVLGRQAAVLVEGPMADGAVVSFEAASLSAGVYVLRLESDRRVLTRTVTVVR